MKGDAAEVSWRGVTDMAFIKWLTEAAGWETDAGRVGSREPVRTLLQGTVASRVTDTEQLWFLNVLFFFKGLHLSMEVPRLGG